MQLYYFKAVRGNFGDDLNSWLWDDLIPGWRDVWPDRVMVGVGTILNNKMPAGVPKIILGSGCGYADPASAQLLAECRVLAVRGPRTAALVGAGPDVPALDPAALLPTLPRFSGVAPHGQVVLVPLHSSMALLDWHKVARSIGAVLVSPEDDAEHVIRMIAGASQVITESMHGAIVSDAFGVPWTAFGFHHLFNRNKWQDWASSLNVTPAITDVPRLGNLAVKPFTMVQRLLTGNGHVPGPLRPIAAAINSATLTRRLRPLVGRTGQLSDRAVLTARQKALRRALDDFRAEFSAAAAGTGSSPA
jgi:succinoglycan biosynthesis protein ExoV